ncbi:MAG: Gfo/Idh/MocA family oxidoreductase [bacterium]|nr:Gfo/Idh/MocA family oxidoreductase [bacterium]
MNNDKIGIGVIGAGYWGPNLIRNFHELQESEVLWVADLSQDSLDKISRRYPSVSTTPDFNNVLADKRVKAVVIATPAVTHFEIAKAALEAGKDVMVEKPLTCSVEESEILVKMAGDRNLVIMVGHLMVYHPAIQYMKSMIDKNELGRIYYLYSTRVNLGKVRTHENTLWNFAPHDISMILYLLGRTPDKVSASGAAYLQSGIEDVAFMTLHFPDETLAHCHVSWLDPHKVRRLTVVGDKKMMVFDDTAGAEVRIYDKGVDRVPTYETYGESLTIRIGDINIPKLPSREPLKEECSHFLTCVRERKQPVTDGASGLEVLKVLVGADRSIRKKGTPVMLDEVVSDEIAAEA